MKRCPKCGRFTVEYDPDLETERCLWKDCNWINKEKNNDFENKKHKYNYKNVRAYITYKSTILN